MDSPHMGQLVLLLVVLVITILAFYWLFGSQILLAAEKARSSQTERWKTFRVSGIPPDWNKDRLRSFLADLDDTVRPVVESLTADIDGRCSIATVTFQDFPKHFQNGQPWKIPLRRLPGSQSARDGYLVLDYAFLGITPLFDPQPEDHKVDIIAISGLGSHAFGSFEERDGNHMWLRDSLPYDLTRDNTTDPIARVMIYGYESSIANSNSFQNLEDLAISFYNSLLALARSPTTRPIIFIAHSLGGLIVKQTLITLSKSKIEDDQKLIKAVYGIVFFGVPHDGMDISSLIPMVEDRPNRFLIESIGHVNSQILSIQQREFYTALGGEGDSEIICFYETEKSRTAQKDKNGNWTMQGPRACLVTKSSATHCRAWERGPEHTCAIARTHSDMVKFGPQDHEYQKARERLIGLARRALVAECGKPSPSGKSPKRHWMVPFERNESFVGREDLLSLLLQRTPPSTKPDACQRTVIEGLGGVGKTQIALETVYRLRDADPSCSILWVPAVDVVTFENAYREIGRLMGVAGIDDDRADVKSLVRVAMNNGDTGRWLLVIDNADDQEVMFGPRGLARYLPCNMKGSILFTTRTREVTERLDLHSAGVIKTAKMSREEAKKMLRIRLTEDQAGDMASTDTLLNFLDDLPLAIRQASAYMHKTGITVARYLEHCCSSDATSVKLLSRDFEDRGRYETSKNPVAMTWLVSFEHILRDNPRAGEYLQFICFLSERDIPISLLPQATDELEADEAIGILDAYAFVTKREGGESIDMHRLVRLAMRNWLRIEGNSQETYRRVITRLDSVYPFPKHENREIWMRYIAHAQSVLHSDEMCADDGALARLLFNVAESLYRQGHYQEAVQMYQQTVEAMEIALGKEHPSTLGSMNNLGLMLKNMGRYSESEQIYRQALGLMEKMHGKKHPSTLISTNNLGLVLDSMGQYSESKQIFQQTLPLMEDILGREHPVTLDSKCNMGVVLDHMGQYSEAEEVCRQTLKVTRTVLGKNHPSTLLIMNNLANVLSRMGKHLDAEKMHRRTLQLREKALGKEHPETLNSMDNLASVLNSMGQYSTAEEILRTTLTLREKVLGEEHPDTLLGRGSLANVLKSMGRYLEAEPVYRQVLKLMEKVLGEKHPSTLSVMDNLGLMLDNIGKYSEADKIHRKTLLLREKALGVEHPERLDSMNNLAVVLGHMGQCVEAETMHRHTLLLREKALGQEHPSTLSSLNNLANVLSSMGKHSEAEKIHRRALQLRESVFGMEHHFTLDSMGNLALVLNAMGNHSEAEKIHRKTLALREKILGEEHPDTLLSRGGLALALGNMGQYSEAERIYLQTIEAMESVLGKEHSLEIFLLDNLAQMLNSAGWYFKAEKISRKTLALRKKVLGEEHPETLNSMNDLGVMLKKTGQYWEAKQVYRQVMEQMQRVLGEEHPSTLVSMNNLANLLDILRLDSEAEKMHRKTLELRQKVLGDEHPSTLDSMNNLAVVLDHMSQYSKAEEIHQRTLLLKDKVLGREHPETLVSMNNLGEVIQHQGRYSEAEMIYRQVIALMEKVHGKEHPHTLHSMNNLMIVLGILGRHLEAGTICRHTPTPGGEGFEHGQN